jgi:hypothetical protein
LDNLTAESPITYDTLTNTVGFDETGFMKEGDAAKVYVKNGTTALLKGQAVYTSGADGANIIVSAASNATEATSSKTLGLLEQDLAANQHGWVITEGSLAGLDTDSATAGDAVWLGTGGNLLYGLANKPSAPEHMVYLGVVTRSNSNNGEIRVHVQNGFELEEIHDVVIDTPEAGQVIVRDDTNSFWKNGEGGSGVTFSDTPPASPKDKDLWFNTLDSSLYVLYNDGNSTQWIEVSVGGDVVEQSTIDVINSRLSNTESRLTAAESDVATILSQSGFYIRQFIVENDTANRSFGTTWALAYTSNNYTGFQAGSKIRFTYQIPFRNESSSWGGAYTEPQISFNGGSTYISLGSSGYDGNVMQLSSASIATYTKTLYIDPALQGITSNFSFRFRIYCKSYDGTARWNQDHDINATSNTATLASGVNVNGHYASFHVEELAVIA